MKVFSKILGVLLALVWACILFMFVVFIFSETGWATAVGQFMTDCWNTVLSDAKTVRGFFNRLGEVIIITSGAMGVITLIYIFFCVRIYSADADETEETKETKMKKKAIEKAAEAATAAVTNATTEETATKKSKGLFKKKAKTEETSTTETTTTTTATTAATTTETTKTTQQTAAEKFLETLRNKKR